MTGLMSEVQGNLGNYRAVAALPSFKLFPWFFVVPGVLIAGVAATSLVWPTRWRIGRWVLVVLGLSLVVAPAVFQMFGRAPDGGQMMSAFGQKVPVPSLSVTGNKISGQIEAWSASWNKLYFNQGSPKPGGAKPGLTKAVTGTYNAKTHAYVLLWTSQVVGGPFNGFTGEWHLTGTFVAKR